MLQFIIPAVFLAGVAVYKTLTSDNNVKPVSTPQHKSLGSFVVWGRPNAGKTTFINQLLDKDVDSKMKEATTSQTKHINLPLTVVDGKSYQISEIIDMPGTKDRLEDWLRLVSSHDHVFYMVNLGRIGESDYISAVRSDLKETVTALQKSSKTKKRINIISSHVDESKWKDIDPSEVNNVLQEDQQFRLQYESMEGVAGYVYAANLTDKDSFKRMLDSIIRDCYA